MPAALITYTLTRVLLIPGLISYMHTPSHHHFAAYLASAKQFDPTIIWVDFSDALLAFAVVVTRLQSVPGNRNIIILNIFLTPY